MAANELVNDETSGCKFPVPVSFDDDTPTPDFCRVVLTVDEMRIKKPLIGKAQPTNAEIRAGFSDGVVQVDVDVITDVSQVRYQYRKPLPYDVIADRCRWEVLAKQPARIAVVLAKATRQSWASQKRHFISPSTN